MAIMLDELDLSGLHMETPGTPGGAAPVTVAETALDGSEVVWEGPAAAARITLAGGTAHGWITRETLDRLTDMAVVAGAVYDLTIGDHALRVRFRNEEPPAVAAVPVEPEAADTPQAPFRDVRIRLVATQ